jgi:hypothetical protein
MKIRELGKDSCTSVQTKTEIFYLYIHVYVDYKIENNTWQNLYSTSPQPETPISARGSKEQGLILVEG